MGTDRDEQVWADSALAWSSASYPRLSAKSVVNHFFLSVILRQIQIVVDYFVNLKSITFSPGATSFTSSVLVLYLAGSFSLLASATFF